MTKIKPIEGSIKVEMNGIVARQIDGFFKDEEITLVLDFLDILINPPGEEQKYDRKALRAIKKAVKEWNTDCEEV